MTDRLDALRASARAAHAATLHHQRLAAESAIAAGVILDEARELCGAGGWAAWLRGTGIAEARVWALLDLHRTALDPDAVVALGGLGIATVWAAVARLPGEDEALAVRLAMQGADRPVPIAYVWPAPDAGAFCAGLLDLNDPDGRSLVTRRPLIREREVWATVWHLLGHRFGEMAFQPIREDAGPVVEALEEHRQSILKAGVHRVH